eukprot:30668_5
MISHRTIPKLTSAFSLRCPWMTSGAWYMIVPHFVMVLLKAFTRAKPKSHMRTSMRVFIRIFAVFKSLWMITGFLSCKDIPLIICSAMLRFV